MKEEEIKIGQIEKSKKQVKQKKQVSKQVSEKVRRSMLTAFVLLFPSLIIVSLMAKLPLMVYAIAWFFYQAVLVKNFIDDHYKDVQ